MTFDERRALDHELCRTAGVDQLRRMVAGTDRGLMYLVYRFMQNDYVVEFSHGGQSVSQDAIVYALRSIALCD